MLLHSVQSRFRHRQRRVHMCVAPTRDPLCLQRWAGTDSEMDRSPNDLIKTKQDINEEIKVTILHTHVDRLICAMTSLTKNPL